METIKYPAIEKLRPGDMLFGKEICTHQFFEINKIFTKKEIQGVLFKEEGIQVQCALCGERRKLWQNKEMEIIK